MTTPERFRSCVHALYVAADPGVAGAGPTELAPVRRCPVGVISSLDCPEFAGMACRCHEARGDREPQVVPRGEVAHLSLELARDYLTAGYLRRLRPLRHEPSALRGAEILAAAPVPVEIAPVPPSRWGGGAIPTVPVNVPADQARKPKAGARAGRRAPARP